MSRTISNQLEEHLDRLETALLEHRGGELLQSWQAISSTIQPSTTADTNYMEWTRMVTEGVMSRMIRLLYSTIEVQPRDDEPVQIRLAAIAFGLSSLECCLALPGNAMVTDPAIPETSMLSSLGIMGQIVEETPGLLATWWFCLSDLVMQDEITRLDFTRYTCSLIGLFDMAVEKFDVMAGLEAGSKQLRYVLKPSSPSLPTHPLTNIRQNHHHGGVPGSLHPLLLLYNLGGLYRNTHRHDSQRGGHNPESTLAPIRNARTGAAQTRFHP